MSSDEAKRHYLTALRCLRADAAALADPQVQKALRLAEAAGKRAWERAHPGKQRPAIRDRRAGRPTMADFAVRYLTERGNAPARTGMIVRYAVENGYTRKRSDAVKPLTADNLRHMAASCLMIDPRLERVSRGLYRMKAAAEAKT